MTDFSQLPSHNGTEQPDREAPSLPSAELDPKQEANRLLPVALSLAALPILTVLTMTVISLIAVDAEAEWVRSPLFFSLSASVCMYLIALPCAFGIMTLTKPTVPSKQSLPALAYPALISATLALTFFGNLIGNVITSLISLLTQTEILNPVVTSAQGVPLWANILSMVILAPIAEELFYRKALINRLRRYGDIPAIVASALVFGLGHGNTNQFFYAILVGALLGCVYCQTGKVWITVLIHMLLNLFGGVYPLLIQKACGGTLPTGLTGELFATHPLGAWMLLLYYAVTLIAIAAALPSMVYLKGQFYPSRPPQRLTWNFFKKAVLINPGVWFACAVMILYFVM